MDISINNNSTNFKGWQEAINIVNPISHSLSRYLTHAAESSHQNINEVTPSLRGLIKTVRLKPEAKSSPTGWDINPYNSKKYVLFLHGMAQNITSEQRLYEAIINQHAGVLALEYRGYGQNNTIKLDEKSLSKDVETAYNYLTNQKGILPQDITVIGHSMGGALATALASKHPEISSLILVSPITSGYGIGDKFITNKTIGIGISQKTHNFIGKIGILNFFLSLRFNSMSKAEKLEVPTYIIQTKNDSVTPYANARLFSNIIRRHGYLKDFIVLPVGGHNIDSRKVNVISQIMDKIDK